MANAEMTPEEIFIEANINQGNNKCPICGGRLVAEFIGSYGDVYLLNKQG